ncbi:metal-dependent hydrolase [Natrialbaceae archaeon A-CW3]
MPWEHVIVGYIGYSAFTHVVYRDSPTTGETVVVVFASVLPDLIDKPLAWEFGVFPSGYALGHSIFFAVPLSVAVGWYTRQRNQPRIGWAFGIGYLLHLPADVIPIYIRDGRFPINRVLWPVRPVEGGSGQGFTGGFITANEQYLEALLELDQSLYMQGVVGLLIAGFLLWVYDGMPIAREMYRGLRQLGSVVEKSIERMFS